MKILMMVLIGQIVSYFATSFLLWDVNPGNWSMHSRFNCLLWGAVISCVGLLDESSQLRNQNENRYI